jgi:hypothetical protein
MPTASPPPAAPEPQPQQSAADRLLRAQAAELEALRAQIKDLPDPDQLLAWRGKAEQFDALAADLPNWKEQLQAAHQQERQQLQSQLQSRDAELQQQQQQHQLQTQFLQAGGNPLHFSAWLELYGSKFVQRTEDGQLVSNENGQIMPIADVLASQRSDALYGVLFHPRYGTGSGGRMGKDARVATIPDLNKMKTGEIFRQAFAKGAR